MKQLTIPEEGQFDFGQCSPALEGFIDTLKGMFNGGNQRKNAVERIKNSQWHLRLKEMQTYLDRDLASTYGNSAWVGKNLPEKSEVVKVHSMEWATYNGKSLLTAAKVLDVAKAMMATLKEIVNNEKPYLDLRKQLISKVNASSDKNDTAEKIWTQYSKQLKETAAHRWIKKKKVTPAFGASEGLDKGWPAAAIDGGEGGFAWDYRKKGEGQFQTPSQGNAREYLAAITELFKMVQELEEIYKATWITSHEESGLDYNNLKDGDDIYSYLYSDQHVDGVSDLASNMEMQFIALINGLYIVMFDKHEQAKKEVK